jgi:hypothetical protein
MFYLKGSRQEPAKIRQLREDPELNEGPERTLS